MAMTRDEVTAWLQGHRDAARVQRVLEVAEAGSSVALSLSLIAAMRATIPATAIEAQRVGEDDRVRAIWNRLRAAARG